MNFKGIDKWSLRYQITRYYVNFAHNTIFYRKVHVTGKENLPENTPLFFAPNHQNALMDALMVLCSIKPQPVFIARADIFKNPLIAKLLIFLKILPAYRIRDGKENLDKNTEIFDTSVKILENKHILTLFPETTHSGMRQLKILKKGVQRIVFQAEEKNNFQLGVKVVPIGIHYSNYFNFRSDIQMNIGKPIEIGEYNEIYKANPQKAMLALRDFLSDEIKKLIIHIPSEQYYSMFDFLRTFYLDKMLVKLDIKKNVENELIAQQKIVAAIEKFNTDKQEEVRQFDIETKAYQRMLKKLNIRSWVIDKNENIIILFIQSIGLIAVTPVFLYGWINHILPYYLPTPIRKKIKDPQFISSINFAIGIVIYPVCYLLQFIIVSLCHFDWWVKFAYLITLPMAGLLAFHIHRSFVKIKAQWKFYLLKNKKYFKKILDLNKKIHQSMDMITGNYISSEKS